MYRERSISLRCTAESALHLGYRYLQKVGAQVTYVPDVLLFLKFFICPLEEDMHHKLLHRNQFVREKRSHKHIHDVKSTM